MTINNPIADAARAAAEEIALYVRRSWSDEIKNNIAAIISRHFATSEGDERYKGWQYVHEHHADLIRSDGLMCEQHPGLEFDHDGCAGPGMPWIVEGKEAITTLAAIPSALAAEQWIECAKCGRKRDASTLVDENSFVCRYCLSTAPISAPAGDVLREQLATLCHEQWSGWMRYQFEKCAFNDNHSLLIPEPLYRRWKRQVDTPYNKLPENEKESDRKEADRFIALFAASPAAPEGGRDNKWQDVVRDHLIKLGAPDSLIDGAGCEGDAYDFTQAEITQAFNYFNDHIAILARDAIVRRVRARADEYKHVAETTKDQDDVIKKLAAEGDFRVTNEIANDLESLAPEQLMKGEE